jgi:hypothetical protein
LVAASCSSDGSSEPTGSTSDTTSPAPSTTDPGGPTSTRPGDTTVPTSTGTGPQGFGSAKLEFFGDCDALLTYMQTEAAERVTAWGLGGGGRYYGDVPMMEGDTAATDNAGGAPQAAPSASAVPGVDYSGTNTQEVGVDEGDIVETDGRFVYVANSPWAAFDDAGRRVPGTPLPRPVLMSLPLPAP